MRNLNNPVTFYGNFPTFRDFWQKARFFLEKTIRFSKRTLNFKLFVKTHYFNCYLRQIWVFGVLKNFWFFTEIIICLPNKTPNIERFDISYRSSHNWSQIWYMYGFQKVLTLSSKNFSIFPKKKTILNVLRILIIPVTSYGNFGTFKDCKSFLVFFTKTPAISQKKFKVWTCWVLFPFQSRSLAKLLPLVIFKNIQFFFEKPFSFF